MAKETKPEIEAEEIQEEEPQQPKRSPRMFILLGFVALVLFQVIGLAFLLPPLLKPQMIEPDPPPDYTTDTTLKTEPVKAELIEKSLGDKFMVRDIGDNNTTNVFSVKVTLRIEKSDEKKFDKIMENRTETVRGVVYAVLRASTLPERKSETLQSIRNTIRVKVNDELQVNYVKDVVCTEPSNEMM